MPINIMGLLKETLPCSTCFELFLARSNPFKLAVACCWLCQFLQVTKSHNVLTNKFTRNQLLQRSASVFISGTASSNYKAGLVVLPSGADNTRQGNFYYKIATFITRWDNNHKVMQANERNRGNRFWQPTPSFNPNLPGDRYFTPI